MPLILLDAWEWRKHMLHIALEYSHNRESYYHNLILLGECYQFMKAGGLT